VFTDDQGQVVAPAQIAGSTVTLPPVRTYAFHVDEAIESAIRDLLKDAGDGHGATRLVAHVDESGQIAIGVLVGHRVSEHFKVAGWGEWKPGHGSEAGAEIKIEWAP